MVSPMCFSACGPRRGPVHAHGKTNTDEGTDDAACDAEEIENEALIGRHPFAAQWGHNKWAGEVKRMV